MLRSHLHLAAIAVAAMLVVTFGLSSSRGSVINLSTGLNGSGAVQTISGAADANWSIGGQAGLVLTPASNDWWGLWPANDSRSAWIAKDPTSNSDNGTGTYTRVFDLTGLDPSTVVMTGNWAVDDEGTLAINGHQIGAYQPHDGWQNFATQTFSVSGDSGWFNPGVNTLTLTIAQADDFFEGVRLNGTLTASVPEPASLGVLLVGGMLLLLRPMSRRGSTTRRA